jgi:hypothetical protein
MPAKTVCHVNTGMAHASRASLVEMRAANSLDPQSFAGGGDERPR